MKLKKILNILIFLAILLNTSGCLISYANPDLEAQKRQTREKINRLKWLENLETDKLYKNQQKLEKAEAKLHSSQKEISVVQGDLVEWQRKLDIASAEYNKMNTILMGRLRIVYKTRRKERFEILLSSGDVNELVDRYYFQGIILKDDLARVEATQKKAKEIRDIRNNMLSQKRRLERSIASIKSQNDYIKLAAEKNKNMIKKLKEDRVAYQKAERELAKQSASIGSYINKSAKDTNLQVASGFIKPIQGRITSYFGMRTHPIFNSKSFHSGIDIGGPNFGEIKASNSGKVIYSGWYGGYGKVVIIEHGIVNGKPITTLYAHMNSIKVANGQRVTKGQVIGYEGTTGYSTGPHCHFEVRVNGQPNNPLNYIGT